MSGVQGIIVCGEASESDEEEEFCAATARGHKSLTPKSGGSTETKGQHKPPEPKHTQKQRPQQQQRKGHQSLLHQKLWEANASMEKNISKSICGPLTTETNRISRLIASLPAAQNSTLTAHSALSHAARNLSNSHFLLAALNNNPLACLKSP